MTLRDYQQNVINEYEQKIAAGIRRIIIVAPTGAGKTVIAAEIIRQASAEYDRVLFIARRNELLTQARDKLKSFEIIAGIIKAGRDKDARPQAIVQVAGIQTLHARAVRAKTMELPVAEIVIIDEAHHVPSADLSGHHRSLSRGNHYRTDGNAMSWRRSRTRQHVRGNDRVPADRR